jgi:hypothetical protein
MFKRAVLPTIAISGMIFASFAMFLSEYGSQRIEIDVDNQDFIYGEVRDFFSPAMGTALSITLGLAGITVVGYSKSLRRKELLEKQLLSVKKAISDKDAQIHKLKNDRKINDAEYIN